MISKDKYQEATFALAKEARKAADTQIWFKCEYRYPGLLALRIMRDELAIKIRRHVMLAPVQTRA